MMKASSDRSKNCDICNKQKVNVFLNTLLILLLLSQISLSWDDFDGRKYQDTFELR